MLRALKRLRFLAINAKGGEILSPKQKDRTTKLQKLFLKWWFMFIFLIGILRWNILIDIFQNWYILVRIFQNWYLEIFDLLSIGKTLLNTKRRISSRGVLFKSKEKHMKQGEKNVKSWKCFPQSYSYIFDYLQKDFEKDFTKDLQKQNKLCKCGPKC